MVNGAVLDGWTVLPDEVVVARILEGHVSLFEVLMRRHNERLYRAARAIVRDDTEAEDVMQQAYINAYAHLRQFDGRASFASWLTRIAVKEASSRTHREKRPPVAEPNGSGRQAFAGAIKVILESAIDALPDGLREVFILCDIEGLSTMETASGLGLSETAVKARLLQARAALKRDLSDHIGAGAAQSFTFLRPGCDRVVAAVLARIG